MRQAWPGAESPPWRRRRRRKGSTVPPVITALLTELVTEPLDFGGQRGSPRDIHNPLNCDDA